MYPSTSMIIAVNDYYGNNTINVNDAQCQKRSATYVTAQLKNELPAKLNRFLQNPLKKIR